jgi:hypothetical protein
MRRALVFLLLGPLAVAIAVTIPFISPVKTDPQIAWLIAATIFFLTLPQSAIVGLIDSYLARRFPMAPRAGLTAAAGAITPCVLITVISSGALPPSSLLPFAIGGAASMGLCSLLTDCLGQPRPSQGYAVALFGD